MKKVCSLIALCAVAAAPAFAAGGMQQQRSQTMDPQFGSQQQTSQAPGQALDEGMVRQIQQQLQSQGYDVQPDGIYGPNTRQALQKFQQDQGMQGSGRVDMDTLAALGVLEGGTQQAQTPQEQEQQQQRQQRQEQMEDQQDFQQQQPGDMSR